MFDKIWDAHIAAEGPGGQTLLSIDRHLLHEGSTHAFDRLQASGEPGEAPLRAQWSSATTRFWTSTKSTLSGSRGRGNATRISALTVPGCGVITMMRSARYTASATLWVT